MTAIPLMNMSWAEQQGTSFRLDVFCLVLAIAAHLPLAFMTLNLKGKVVDREKGERLVSVDLIDPEFEKKALPPPPPPPKKKSIFDKIKAKLMKKETPPPPPKVKPKLEPKKLKLQPKKIALDPKIKTGIPNQTKLKTKAGFKTKADPKLVQRRKISLSKGGVGFTPLSVKKMGVIKNRKNIKTGRNGFKLAQSAKISGIGGSGPSLVAGGPSINIKTSKRGSREKFSAARLQPKTDKGRLGAVGVPKKGDGSPMTLRDRIIARDAPKAMIGSSSSRRSGGGGGGCCHQTKCGPI